MDTQLRVPKEAGWVWLCRSTVLRGVRPAGPQHSSWPYWKPFLSTYMRARTGAGFILCHKTSRSRRQPMASSRLLLGI